MTIFFCHYSRFYFTDQTRVSSTTGGENSVVQMLGSLYDSIEGDYGAFSTRLYRAFRPKSGSYINFIPHIQILYYFQEITF